MKKVIIFLTLMVVMAGVGWGATSLRDYGQMMNIQGRVTLNSTRANVADGNYTFTFTLKRAQHGVTGISWADAGWSESKNVGIQDGIFNAILGEATYLPPFDPSYDYRINIQISTSSGSDNLGDQELYSVPLALTARNLYGKNNSNIDINSTSTKNPVHIKTTAYEGIAISGEGTGTRGVGILGQGPTSKGGVIGKTTDAPDITEINFGVAGASNAGAGIYGLSAAGAGVSGTGVTAGGSFTATGSSRPGVYGFNANGHGVMGETSGTRYGVYGNASGTGNSGTGVFGKTESSNGFDAGVYAYADKGAPALFAWQASGTANQKAVYALATAASDAIVATASTGKAIVASNNTADQPTLKLDNDAAGPALEIGFGKIRMGNPYVICEASETEKRVDAICGQVLNRGGSRWVKIYNSYIKSGRDIIFATGQNERNYVGVRNVIEGSFELYIGDNDAMAFLVISGPPATTVVTGTIAPIAPMMIAYPPSPEGTTPTP